MKIVLEISTHSGARLSDASFESGAPPLRGDLIYLSSHWAGGELTVPVVMVDEVYWIAAGDGLECRVECHEMSGVDQRQPKQEAAWLDYVRSERKRIRSESGSKP